MVTLPTGRCYPTLREGGCELGHQRRGITRPPCPAGHRSEALLAGPIIGTGFQQTVAEIARLFALLGQGMLLRKASKAIRFEAGRPHVVHTSSAVRHVMSRIGDHDIPKAGGDVRAADANRRGLRVPTRRRDGATRRHP